MEKELTVKISAGNIKMGEIPSVSLPPIKTCAPDACKTCGKKGCYAKRMYNRLPTVKESYDRNLNILENDPEKYWRAVEGAVLGSTTFRFHVSGDILNTEYLQHMVEIAERNKHCEIIAFTKRFDFCNEYLASHNYEFPQNLHIIYSAWKGLEMINPFNMPECHVIFKDGTMTASEEKRSYYCSGNCFECFKNKHNCFNLKKGEQILIKQH